MPQSAIFGPFLALILLTLVVWVYMYMRRIPFIQSLGLEPNQVTPAALAKLSPPSVSNPSDNLKNLFEIPVLFYALALYLFVTEQVDAMYVIAAWVFFGLRALHSAVHCSVNIVMLRFVVYALSTVTLGLIALRAIFRYFGS